MKKNILTILTLLALICGFLILTMIVCTLIFSSEAFFDMKFTQTFATYVGSWAPEWTLSAVAFLLGVSIVLIIANKKWWAGWLALAISNILPLHAFITERYILVSPMPEWEKGIIVGDSFMFYLFIILQICAIAGIVVTCLSNVEKM